MTDINNQIIICPICKASITVDELGEYVSSNPDTKKQAIEEQLELWGDSYVREYLIQNAVFCTTCGKVNHYDESVMIMTFLFPFFPFLFSLLSVFFFWALYLHNPPYTTICKDLSE